ncbi:unnamed protein product [Ranitomeya imitator]|uniref:Uncharacterized protein n=1 Tax=Ranitomeya imitator TaxID=111125 RepID=A0ABN9LN02_9NEOB|nr:unnamed protein product [Ranitomeya imitator]
MLLPAPRDRPSSAMYQSGPESGQRCVYPRALFQQVLGPCKPCSDPNLSVAEKGHYSLHFDAFHPSVGDGGPALPSRSLRKSPLHTIPASPTSPQSCLDGSNSPLSGSASSGVSSLSEGTFPGCPDGTPSTDPRTEEQQSGCFQHYPPVRYSLSDPNGLEAAKVQPCRSHSAPTGVTPPRSPCGERDEGNAEHDRLRRPRRNCHTVKEQAARVGWDHNMGKP